MKKESVVKKYIFLNDDSNEFLKNIDFSKNSILEVSNISIQPDYINVDDNKNLHDYIFKFYAYNEILSSYKQKNNDIVQKEDLKIFQEYSEFINDFSKRIFSFILYACLAEARHNDLNDLSSFSKTKENRAQDLFGQISQIDPIEEIKKILCLKFNNENEISNFDIFIDFIGSLNKPNITGDDGKIQRKMIESNMIENSNVKDMSIEYTFKLLSVLFIQGFTSEGYGGYPWSAIAQHALSFSRGEISAEIFIDQALSLQHNNGNMFNKNFIFNDIDKRESFFLFDKKDKEIKSTSITLDINSIMLNLQSSNSVLSLSHFNNLEWDSLVGNLKYTNNKEDILKLHYSKQNFIKFKEVANNIESFQEMHYLSQKLDYHIPKFDYINFMISAASKKSYYKEILQNHLNENEFFSQVMNGDYVNKTNNTTSFFQLHNLNTNNSKKLNKKLIGGKAYGLTNLINKGFNVPKALVFDTKTCLSYIEDKEYFNKQYKDIDKQISDYLIDDNKQPLLVSVRSGAAVSMPGMMDTILNVGIDEKSYPLLCKNYGKDIISECVISFMTQFCNSKLGIEIEFSSNITLALEKFTNILKNHKINTNEGSLFPLSKEAQIKLSVEAVFDSWNSPRAIAWRNEKKIDHNLGTAATIQQMVFGNKNDKSLTCVIFSRDCITVKPDLMGEYLQQAQGEDLVSGKKTPLPISELKISNPQIYKEIEYIAKTLEEEQKAIQDIEITVEDGKVYVLQMRNAVVSPEAQLALAKDMGLNILDVIQPKSLIGEAKVDTLLEHDYQGLAASPGLISGIIVKNYYDFNKYKDHGKDLIFFSYQALPQYAPLMISTQGFITEFGGATSHAAILARSMGKPCVVGIGKQSYDNLESGSLVTIDASEGKIWEGELPIVINQEKAIILADKILKENNIEIKPCEKLDNFEFKIWTSNLLKSKILNNLNNNKHKMFLNIAQKTALALHLEHIEKKSQITTISKKGI